MQFRLYLPFRSLKSIINIEVLDLLVGAENSIAAWALVGHVLEVVNAAGDASAGPEASDDKPTHNKPGEEAHLGLGDGGDVLLAVGTEHLSRKGIEEGHGVDNNWLLDHDLALMGLFMQSILLGRWSSFLGRWSSFLDRWSSFLDMHPPNLYL